MSRREELEEIERLVKDTYAYVRAIWRFLTQARTATLDFQEGDPMGTATATFVDSTGAVQAPPKGDGSGLTVTFSATDPAVITFSPGVVSGNTATATGTRATDAAFTMNAVVANTSGTPLLDDDGVTPFVQPAPIDVPAVTPPAQATTATLSFTE